MEAINRWDALPEECKSMILSRLSTKEVARIARVSKEFLRAVNVMRSSVQLLVLPPTLSVSALEGMVAAHPNVKSLSFKRCGTKLKSFVPILKAAATGCVTVVETDRFDSAVSEKKKVRSLTAIDFRNCMHLIDTDVSILCSLHSRLQEVDLTNCPFMTDAALLTLSRYRHVEKTSDPLEKYSCYPRFLERSSKVSDDTCTELDEAFLRINDAAVFEEIQGLGLNSTNMRSWPRISSSLERSRKETLGHSQASSRKQEDGKSTTVGPYSNLSRRGDSSSSATVNPMPKKSYAQMAATSLEKLTYSADFATEKSTAVLQKQSVKPPELSSPGSSVQNNDSGSFSAQEPVAPDSLLPFIDWTLCKLDNKAAKSTSQSLIDTRLLSHPEHGSTSSTSWVPDDNLSRKIVVSNLYQEVYKRHLLDEVENPSSVRLHSVHKVSLSTGHRKCSSQAHYKPSLLQVGETGSTYTSLETAMSDNQMMRTRTDFFIPKLPSADDDGSDMVKPKAVCIAASTEIRDQRVKVDPLRKVGAMTSKCNSEAFCRTINHVGVFSIPDANSQCRSDPAERDKLNQDTLKSSDVDGFRNLASGETATNSQLAICLPDSANIGGRLRRNMQCLQPPHCQLETDLCSDRTAASEGQSDVEIDTARDVPGLRTVCVASCPEITDRGVQALLKGASRSCLSTLDVSRCVGVTNAGLRLPARSGLQHLIAVQMPAINRLVYQLPIQTVLQHLNLAGCYKLEELVLVASSLKTLNLSNCKKLARLHLKCPSLTALNLSLCESLERFIKFQCGALQSLNFMGCRMLLQSSLNAVIDSATSLEDLRCGGCDRIERLDLVQPTLRTLEVSGNQSLKRLFCQSKVLRAVDACGCKTLAEVYLYSPYLRRMLFSNCALLQNLVIPLDAIKETMDAAAAQDRRVRTDKQDELEISISGCNMPELVKKNLTKLTKQWQSCFKSAN